MPGRFPTIGSERIEILDPVNVARVLSRLSEERADLSQLSNEANERGYTASADQLFGYRLNLEATREIQPPPDAQTGPGVQGLEMEILLRSYARENDQAAAGLARVIGGEYVAEYAMLVEAPAGDFGRVSEFTVQDGRLLEVDGWWDAFVGCVGGCGLGCASVLTSCRGTWAQFLWCLVERCGFCVLRCVGCATCNCSWWCSWATGCCRH